MTRQRLAAIPSIAPELVDEDLADLEVAIAALQRIRDRMASGRESAPAAVHDRIERITDCQPLAVIAGVLGWKERRTSDMLREAGLKVKLGKARSARVVASMSAVENHLRYPPGTLSAMMATTSKPTRNDKEIRQSSSKND